VDPHAIGADAQRPEPDRPPDRPARLPRSTPRRIGAVLVALAALGVVGLGLARSGGSAAIDAGAAPGSTDAPADVAARSVWRDAPADAILGPKITREATEAYWRLGVDPDESCNQLPAAFLKALAPAGCARLVQATYVDSTESVLATVGFVVTGGGAAQRAALFQNWTADSFARQYSMMPSTYPVKATLSASFHDAQRVAWMSGVSGDGTYVAFTVAGFVDGRQGPDAAAFARGAESELQSDSPPVQVADDLPTAVLDALEAQAKAADGGRS
jgi:hypothetical protein